MKYGYAQHGDRSRDLASAKPIFSRTGRTRSRSKGPIRHHPPVNTFYLWAPLLTEAGRGLLQCPCGSVRHDLLGRLRAARRAIGTHRQDHTDLPSTDTYTPPRAGRALNDTNSWRRRVAGDEATYSASNSITGSPARRSTTPTSRWSNASRRSGASTQMCYASSD